MTKKPILIWTLAILIIGFSLHQLHLQKQHQWSSEIDHIEKRIESRENLILWLSDSTNASNELLEFNKDSLTRLIKMPNGLQETIYLIDSLERFKSKLAQITSSRSKNEQLKKDSALNYLIRNVNRPLARQQILILDKQIKYVDYSLTGLKIISLIYILGIVLILFKWRKKSANTI